MSITLAETSEQRIKRNLTLRSFPEYPLAILASRTRSTSSDKVVFRNITFSICDLLSASGNSTRNLHSRLISQPTINFDEERINEIYSPQGNLSTAKLSSDSLVKVKRSSCGCKNQNTFLLLFQLNSPMFHEGIFYLKCCLMFPWVFSSAQHAVNLQDSKNILWVLVALITSNIHSRNDHEKKLPRPQR